MKFTVDRIEGDKVVLLLRNDERQQLVIPTEELPPGIHEGAILQATFTVDKEEEDAARDRVRKLINRLVEKGKA